MSSKNSITQRAKPDVALGSVETQETMMMEQAKNGNRVRVEFVGTLADGTVFGRATEQDPLEFTLGNGEIIPGFEEVVAGMEPGQSKTASIPPDKAFGTHDERKCVQIHRDKFPEGMEPVAGKRIKVRQSDGNTISGTVGNVSDSDVIVDFNHPLAGKELNLSVKLLDVL